MSRRLLSSGELANVLGVSRRSITRYANHGLISVDLVTAGGRYRFDPDTVRDEIHQLTAKRRAK